MALKACSLTSGKTYVTNSIAACSKYTLPRNFCGVISAAGECGSILINNGSLNCSTGGGTTPTYYGGIGPLVVASGSTICSQGPRIGVMSGYFFD